MAQNYFTEENYSGRDRKRARSVITNSAGVGEMVMAKGPEHKYRQHCDRH